jgi:ribonuclease HI
MKSFAVFTDASLNPKLHLGAGACLIVPAAFLEQPAESIEASTVDGLIRIKRFEETSSAALEVRTVLWALEEYRSGLQDSGSGQLRLYCDSQCIAGLPGRRAALEAGEYISRATGRPLYNATLYRAFYERHDQLGFEIIKVAGHTRTAARDTVHRIFSYIDKEARRALRLWVQGEVAGKIRSPLHSY